MDRRMNDTKNRSIYIRYNNSSSSSSRVRWGEQGGWNNSYNGRGRGRGRGDEDGGGLMKMMMAWPPRCYRCSFCKREFRSAQALGGHMNVHRRDRAQLRQLSSTVTPTTACTLTLPDTTDTTSTSTINLNFPPNPDHHMLLSPPSPLLPPPSFQSPTWSSDDNLILANKHSQSQSQSGSGCFFPTNLVATTSPDDDLQPKLSSGLGFKPNDHHYSYSYDHPCFNNAPGFLRLDLQMNILPQDVDLELRLGYN